MGAYIDLTGNRFTNLTVIKRVIPPDHITQRGPAYFECKCDCGNVVIVLGTTLRQGDRKTCGVTRCPYLHDLLRDASKKHGMGGSPEYMVYKCMIYRCYKEEDIAYSRYGGRGIKVCDR